MCEVYTNNNVRLIGRIRNSFRGKNKRHNMVTVHSIVLIGLHEWEKIPKNCNLLVIYESNQIEQLRNNPNINIDNVLRLQLSGTIFQSSTKNKTEFDFVEEHIEIAPQHLPKNAIDFEIDATEEVNIDDI